MIEAIVRLLTLKPQSRDVRAARIVVVLLFAAALVVAYVAAARIGVLIVLVLLLAALWIIFSWFQHQLAATDVRRKKIAEIGASVMFLCLAALFVLFSALLVWKHEAIFEHLFPGSEPPPIRNARAIVQGPAVLVLWDAVAQTKAAVVVQRLVGRSKEPSETFIVPGKDTRFYDKTAPKGRLLSYELHSQLGGATSGTTRANHVSLPADDLRVEERWPGRFVRERDTITYSGSLDPSGEETSEEGTLRGEVAVYLNDRRRITWTYIGGVEKARPKGKGMISASHWDANECLESLHQNKWPCYVRGCEGTWDESGIVFAKCAQVGANSFPTFGRANFHLFGGRVSYKGGIKSVASSKDAAFMVGPFPVRPHGHGSVEIEFKHEGGVMSRPSFLLAEGEWQDGALNGLARIYDARTGRQEELVGRFLGNKLVEGFEVSIISPETPDERRRTRVMGVEGPRAVAEADRHGVLLRRYEGTKSAYTIRVEKNSSSVNVLLEDARLKLYRTIGSFPVSSAGDECKRGSLELGPRADGMPPDFLVTRHLSSNCGKELGDSATVVCAGHHTSSLAYGMERKRGLVPRMNSIEGTQDPDAFTVSGIPASPFQDGKFIETRGDLALLAFCFSDQSRKGVQRNPKLTELHECHEQLRALAQLYSCGN